MCKKIINRRYYYRQKENEKYIKCCNILSDLYLKSNDGKININDILNDMSEYDDAKIVLKRILSLLKVKNSYSKKVSLTYSDYLTLQSVRDNLNNQSNQIVSIVLSMGAFILSVIAVLISVIGLNNILFAIFFSILAGIWIFEIFRVLDQLIGK